MANSLFNFKAVNRLLFSFKLTAVVILVASLANVYAWLAGNTNSIFTGYSVNPLATMKIITSISFIVLGALYFLKNKKIIHYVLALGLFIQGLELVFSVFNLETSYYWALSSPATIIMFVFSFLGFYFLSVKPKRQLFLLFNGSLYILASFSVFSYLLEVGQLNTYKGFETLSWNTSILFFIHAISMFEFKLVKIVDKLQLQNVTPQETHPYLYYPLFFLTPIVLITFTSILTHFNYLSVLDSALIIILFLSVSSLINMFLYFSNFIKYSIERNERAELLILKNSELTNLNKKLRKLNGVLNKKKSYLEDFASITSHSLREPIVALGELQKVTDYQSKEKAIAHNQLFGMYDSAIQRLNHGINSLINYHKFINTEYTQKKPEMTLSESIQYTLNKLAALKPTDMALELDIASDPVLPKVHINNILENLFTNAFKFRKNTEPLVVKISAYRVNGCYKIIFQDNGIGISNKVNRADIFKKGKRFHHNSRSHNGYGLFFVKLYVSRLNGKIKVYSTAQKGTAFVIEIKS
ncbi:ATP-binding protein [Bizionia sediminis]|uniref:histidine kinase n=1 Tax=Bizionia sediminis TaxID=1737064 RepID=A0ABW5KP78_9FLAO